MLAAPAPVYPDGRKLVESRRRVELPHWHLRPRNAVNEVSPWEISTGHTKSCTLDRCILVGVALGWVQKRHRQSRSTQHSGKLLSESIFQTIDQDQSGRIDRLELKRAMRLLNAETGANIDDDKDDHFFFTHSRVAIERWQSVVCDSMLEDLLASADTFCKEQPQQSGKDLLLRLDEYHDLKLKTFISDPDLDVVSSSDLLELLPRAAVEAVELASVAAARDALGGGGDAAVPGTRLNGEEMVAAGEVLEKRHRFRSDNKLQQACLRMHGTISIEDWQKGISNHFQSLGMKKRMLRKLSSSLAEDVDMVQTLENGRPKNPLFDFRAWETSQSPGRWWRALTVVFRQPRVFSRMVVPLAMCLSTAAAVSFCNNHLAPLWGVHAFVLPGELFTLTATILGLLLVFRTNSAYARYDEARNIWADSVSRCRDLARQSVWMDDLEQRSSAIRLVSAFGILLKCHLREPSRHDVLAEVAQHLSVKEVRAMGACGLPPPLWVLNSLAWTVNAANLHEWKAMQMSENISELIANVGKCERLLSTPMPITYSRLCARFLIAWLMLLPFYLYVRCPGIAQVMLKELYIAFFFLQTEDIGHHIEEPFSVLPLDALTAMIAKQAKQVEEQHQIGLEAAAASF